MASDEHAWRSGRSRGWSGGRGGASPGSVPAGRIALAFCGPMALTVGLTAAALAVPIWAAPSPEDESAGVIRLGAYVSSVAMGHDGQAVYAVAYGHGIMRVGLDRPERPELTTASTHETRLLPLPSGGGLVVAGSDGKVQLWDPTTLEVRAGRSAHGGAVMALASLDDGRGLMSVDHAGHVLLWELPGLEPVGEARLRPGVTCLDVAPGGDRVAIGYGDGTVSVVATSTFSEEAAWEACRSVSPITSVRFSPDGRLLATVGLNVHAQLWEVGGSWAMRRTVGEEFPVACSLDFSPDGRLMATGHVDGRIRWWDVRTGSPALPTIDVEAASGIQHRVGSLSLAPDGRTLVAACNGSIRLLGVPGA